MKLRVAALEVQAFTTLALVHGLPVVVVQTSIVAAVPVSHLSHFAHCGIVKSNIAAPLVHEFTTLA